MNLISDKYQVVKKLNNRNSVFLVKDKADGKLWVEKIIEAESIKIYEIMLRINHPNIARIREMQLIGNCALVIEEYVEGITLYDAVENNGCFSIFQTKKIICMICDGLKCIHENNIVHRDISPNNIIITPMGDVKLIDLGISRMKNKEKRVDTYFMGTEGFTAPEQFGFKQTDERADIFSIGAVMNYMLTGKLPAEGVYNKSKRVSMIILKCIEMDSNNRYKNVNSLRRVVKAVPDENTNIFMRFIKSLPGLRSLVWWKMLLLGVHFLVTLFLLYACAIVYDESGFIETVIFIVYVIIGWIFPYLLAGNFNYYIDSFKFTKNLSTPLKYTVCCIFGFILMVITFEALDLVAVYA